MSYTNYDDVLEQLRAAGLIVDKGLQIDTTRPVRVKVEGRDRETYDQGLVGILRGIHDRIDAEVAAAYG